MVIFREDLRRPFCELVHPGDTGWDKIGIDKGRELVGMTQLYVSSCAFSSLGIESSSPSYKLITADIVLLAPMGDYQQTATTGILWL